MEPKGSVPCGVRNLQSSKCEEQAWGCGAQAFLEGRGGTCISSTRSIRIWGFVIVSFEMNLIYYVNKNFSKKRNDLARLQGKRI